jgi:hypothetical protein
LPACTAFAPLAAVPAAASFAVVFFASVASFGAGWQAQKASATPAARAYRRRVMILLQSQIRGGVLYRKGRAVAKRLLRPVMPAPRAVIDSLPDEKFQNPESLGELHADATFAFAPRA